MPDVGLVLDPVFEGHDTGPGHPERPARAAAVRRALEASGLADRCRRLRSVPAADLRLIRVHDPDHVRRVDAASESGAFFLDSMDTRISPDSARIARLAAGSVAELALEVARGGLRRGFAAVRPPGHHAERDLAMGFCLFNNVAVTARALQAEAGVERILIVDWDVHHGNGTQHLFEEDPSVFFFSTHQMPLYPGTGARHERGRGEGEGFTLNWPLRPGNGDAEFLAAFREGLLPAAEVFRPEIVLVSAGFDAHTADPLGGLNVSTDAFREATRLVLGIASRYCEGRLVSILEGGYDLDALAESAAAHLELLL
jgi:acetoin utilization deacetylase AcuC-like enzyme